MDEFIFKRLTKESIIDLYWLFKSSSKARTSLKELQQKYNTDYTGISYIGYLVYDSDNKPAAFYGIIPTYVLIKGNKVLAAQAVDAITHPKHQRKGLFIKLILKINELAKNEGIQFIFGFPNEKSFPVYINKLNWLHIGNMQKFVCQVPMLPFSQLFRRNEILKSIYQLWVSFVIMFIKKSTGFENPNINSNNIGTLRDECFFSYKNYNRKHIIIICGKKVWLKFDGTLKIGEIENSNNTELSRIIKRLKLIAFITGIQKIQFQCNTESVYFPKFSSIASAKVSLPIIYFDLSGSYPSVKLAFSLADFDTF